jgi:hypothetical protein
LMAIIRGSGHTVVEHDEETDVVPRRRRLHQAIWDAHAHIGGS